MCVSVCVCVAGGVGDAYGCRNVCVVAMVVVVQVVGLPLCVVAVSVCV